MPTFRAKDTVIGCRPTPSLEFQFIFARANDSRALSRKSVLPHDPISSGAGMCKTGYSSHQDT
jgi:hypothetical protein